MARKSREALEKEFTKERAKFLKFWREIDRCHPESKRLGELKTKAILAEENCYLLLRKIHNIKPGSPDKLI